jgi:hypothetical protein
MPLTAQDRRIIVDKDEAIQYCRNFYSPYQNSLNDMAYAAQTGGTAFLSCMTEKETQSTDDFAQLVCEQLFLTALGMLPAALPLTKFWIKLNETKPFIAERAKDLLSQVPSAIVVTVKHYVETPSYYRTQYLRVSLENIGVKISRGRNAIHQEWSHAVATVLDKFQKGQPNLKAWIKERLGPLPVWRNFQKELSYNFEEQLFKAYLKKTLKLKVPGWRDPLHGRNIRELIVIESGLNNTQLAYIKERFNIKSLDDLARKFEVPIVPLGRAPADLGRRPGDIGYRKPL